MISPPRKRFEEAAISRVYGHTQGLRAAQIRQLERLYRRKISPHLIVTQEVARQLTEISAELERQVGILVDRRGGIAMVLVGDDHKVEIPSLDGFRRGAMRLVGLRLIHTHLRGEPLTQDDMTDLAHLRLDLICQIQVLGDGLPGRIQAAHLLPVNARGQQWEILEAENPSRMELDVLSLVEALENEFSRSLRARSPDGRGERALLVGVYPGGERGGRGSMEELRELARSSGLQVLDAMMQVRPQPDPRFVLGKGKLEELIIHSKQVGAEILLFDRDLTSGQLRNLSLMTDQKIIDRTQLILDIFAQHAHSRDGKIQVELAQLKYLLPRLVGKNPALSRLRGGIGLRGPGETKLEVDRRRARERIARLERALDDVRRARVQRRSQRTRRGLPIISIVGYTNAGKSTLLNALTHSDVLVEDKLFATLDPASRRLRFPKERDVILTDTVGFIHNLPPDLINAFRSTLEELEDADLLIHVADLSSPYVEEQISAVNDLLAKMNLDKKARLLVFNKADLVEGERERDLIRGYGGVAISALRREGLEELSARLQELVFGPQRAGVLVSLPYRSATQEEAPGASGSEVTGA